MPFQLILRDRAVDEIQNAYSWYEMHVQGLGDRFLNTIQNYLAKIQENPNYFKKTYKEFHEVYIRKFPFVIIYYFDKKNRKIVIISVFHASRNPENKFL